MPELGAKISITTAQAKQAVKDYQNLLKTANAEMLQMSRGQRAMMDRELTAVRDKLGGTTREWETMKWKAVRALDGIESKLEANQAALKQWHLTMSKAGNIATRFGTIAKAGFIAGAGALTLLGHAAFKAHENFENLFHQMVALTGTTQAAGKAMQEYHRFALGAGAVLPQDERMQTFRGVQTITQRYGIENQRQLLLQSVAGLSKFTGASAETTMRGIELGFTGMFRGLRTATGGVLNVLKSDFAKGGKYAGMSYVEGVVAALKEINADKMVGPFLNELSVRWNAFKEQTLPILVNIGAAIEEHLSEALKKVMEVIDDLRSSGKLEAWAKAATAAINTVIDAVTWIVVNLAKHPGWVAIAAGITGIAGAVAIAAPYVISLTGALFALGAPAILTGLAVVAGAIAGIVTGLATAYGMFKAVGALADPLQVKGQAMFTAGLNRGGILGGLQSKLGVKMMEYGTRFQPVGEAASLAESLAGYGKKGGNDYLAAIKREAAKMFGFKSPGVARGIAPGVAGGGGSKGKKKKTAQELADEAAKESMQWIARQLDLAGVMGAYGKMTYPQARQSAIAAYGTVMGKKGISQAAFADAYQAQKKLLDDIESDKKKADADETERIKKRSQLTVDMLNEEQDARDKLAADVKQAYDEGYADLEAQFNYQIKTAQTDDQRIAAMEKLRQVYLLQQKAVREQSAEWIRIQETIDGITTDIKAAKDAKAGILTPQETIDRAIAKAQTELNRAKNPIQAASAYQTILAQLLKQQEAMKEAGQEGTVAWEQLQQDIDSTRDRLKDLIPTGTLKDAITDLANYWKTNFRGIFYDLGMRAKSFADFFKSLWKEIVQSIKSMLVKLAVDKLFNAIFVGKKGQAAGGAGAGAAATGMGMLSSAMGLGGGGGGVWSEQPPAGTPNTVPGGGAPGGMSIPGLPGMKLGHFFTTPVGIGLAGFGTGYMVGGMMRGQSQLKRVGAGALSGAMTGFMLGGPEGALIGGVLGALGGFLGGKKKKSPSTGRAVSGAGGNVYVTQTNHVYSAFDLENTAKLAWDSAARAMA